MNKKFLIALPTFRGDDKTWNHQTILVSAKNKKDAIDIVMHLKPASNIGRVEQVNY